MTRCRVTPGRAGTTAHTGGRRLRAVLQHLADRLGRRAIERHEPLLATLAINPRDTARQIDVTKIEPDQLAQSQTGGVEQLKNCLIATSGDRRDVRRGQQSFHLGRGKVRRQYLLLAWRADEPRWVFPQHAFADEIARERAERGKMTGTRRTTEIAIVQVAKKITDTIRIERLGRHLTGLDAARCSHMFDELFEIRRVRSQRVRRDIAVELQKFEELAGSFLQHGR